ncbi:MAG TPA: NERD domain-containing protein, partial [Solirubrobacterales bacterium]|nr:NERD domain-containing protein [Solirubrobacterales bacterium]
MAVMYPRTLLEGDLKSRAEGKVFEALEAGLDDEWEVFHSVGWVARDKTKGSGDGEIDFVVAHHEQGALCLEVKGGGIECKHGEWYGIHDGK